MKNHKSPGGDNITAELLKKSSELYFESFILITLIWEQEILAKD